jgi:hypothetical protein
MTSRKEKENISPEGNFSFRAETKTTHHKSPTIKIGPKSERDGVQPSSSERNDGDFPHEVSNLKGHLKLHKTHMDNTQSLVN